jgi:hypothetical protein
MLWVNFEVQHLCSFQQFHHVKQHSLLHAFNLATRSSFASDARRSSPLGNSSISLVDGEVSCLPLQALRIPLLILGAPRLHHSARQMQIARVCDLLYCILFR